VGHINAGRICVARYRPGTRRALSPRFIGRIESRDEGAFIVGSFEISLFEKLSVLLFAVGCLVAAVVGLWKQMPSPRSTVDLVGVVVFLVLIPLSFYALRLGWKLRQDDVLAIQRYLESTVKIELKEPTIAPSE